LIDHLMALINLAPRIGAREGPLAHRWYVIETT
jgi:hypothetical protein